MGKDRGSNGADGARQTVVERSIDGADDLERQLRDVRTELEDGSTIRVRMVVTPRNWFDIYPVATRCHELGAELEFVARDRDGRGTFTTFPALDDARLVDGLLGEQWTLFAGDRRPGSVTADAHNELCADVRAQISEIAEAHVWNEPEAVLRGRSEELAFALPPLGHAFLTDPELAAMLCRWLLLVGSCPPLVAWVADALAEDRDALHAAATQHAWLRLFLAKATLLDARTEGIDLLRALYLSADERPGRVAEDRAFAERAGVADGAAALHEWLGLEHLRERTRPFEIGEVVPRAASTGADVTVLVPSFRHEHYIRECLESVLAQTYPAFRLLVVDDRSPDGTVATARGLDDPRLEVRVNDANLGLGNSVLAALETIDTPFVALLNSDDLFHPDRLEACRRVLLDDADAEVVATALVVVDSDGGELTPTNTSRLADGREVYDWVHWYASAQPAGHGRKDLFAELLRHNFLATSTNLFCRTDFLRAQATELRSLKYCLDWHVFLEAARKGTLRWIDERLAAYRMHTQNTVWFREGRRWSYFLEVNRVAANAVRARLDGDVDDDDRLEVLELACERLAENTELFGLALFVNDVVGAVDVERLSNESPAARDVVVRLNELAERATTLRYALDGLGDTAVAEVLEHAREVPNLRVAFTLGSLAAEEVSNQRGRADFLVGELERARQQQRNQLAARERLEQDIADRRAELVRRADRLQRRVDELARSVDGVEPPPIESDDAPRDGADRLNVEINRLASVADQVLRQWNRLLGDHVELTRKRNELSRAVDRLREDRRLLEARVRRVRKAHDERGAELVRVRERLGATRGELETTRRTLELTRKAWFEEKRELLGSIEWRTGNFVWNKVPGMRKISRLGKRVRVRSLESAARTKMFLKRLFRRRKNDGLKIAAASTGQFPVISHTFVYQELLSMHEMLGADVQLFHYGDGDRDGLHAAFRYLDEHRTQLQSTWDLHTADYEHYRERMPDRVQSLFEVLAEHSSMSVEQIEKDYQVRMAFTFARRVELFGADYIHTYFFYEQSLGGLVAGWLLDLPRGVSAYADHMMDDHPLKVVPLHMRLADVVVATSQRIKDELIGLSSPEFADKIIVKPNAVDGNRFTYRDRGPARSPLEVLSISRLEPKKGLLDLVDAIAMLRDRGHAVVVHVIGSADEHSEASQRYAQEFRDRIEKHGLGDAIVLHGNKKQEELAEFFTRCHAFVAPYVETESGDKDGIPTAILEAIGTGLPIVTTTAGSIREIVDDGVHGYIVDQHDPPAFADAVAKLVEDPELASRLGRAARERFEAEFDSRVVEKRLHDRIRAAVTKRSTTTS